jgi:hypothetical protein
VFEIFRQAQFLAFPQNHIACITTKRGYCQAVSRSGACSFRRFGGFFKIFLENKHGLKQFTEKQVETR